MAVQSAFPKASAFLILSSLLTLLTLPCTTADESNILLTGDVLTTDRQLSYTQDNTFVIQDDCNLVLYNKGSGYQSDTSGFGTNCTLTLDNHGQFVIKNGYGNTVWTSFTTTTPDTKEGNYATVLRPDGQVAVYGPVVWSTPPLSSTSNNVVETELANIPMTRNVLFSSQILYDNAQLATRDYTFVMQSDCNLAYIKATNERTIWQTGTSGKGKNCFMRLNHRGQLAVADDRYEKIWSSKVVSEEGDYVLIVQVNGQAVVYGPIVWSTSST